MRFSRLCSFGQGAALLALLYLTSCAAGAIPQSAPMPIGRLTLAPRGYVDFCLRENAPCTATKADAARSVTTLTPERWRELNDVNVAVNRAIKPATDESLYKLAEYWTYADVAGDCEDYALDKQRALKARGWPQDSLLLATARNERGEMHAVLVVTTDRGDFVLDNASDFVTPWQELPYRWVARQDRSTPLAWHRAGTAAAADMGTAALAPPAH